MRPRWQAHWPRLVLFCLFVAPGCEPGESPTEDQLARETYAADPRCQSAVAGQQMLDEIAHNHWVSVTAQLGMEALVSAGSAFEAAKQGAAASLLRQRAVSQFTSTFATHRTLILMDWKRQFESSMLYGGNLDKYLNNLYGEMLTQESQRGALFTSRWHDRVAKSIFERLNEVSPTAMDDFLDRFAVDAKGGVLRPQSFSELVELMKTGNALQRPAARNAYQALIQPSLELDKQIWRVGLKKGLTTVGPEGAATLMAEVIARRSVKVLLQAVGVVTVVLLVDDLHDLMAQLFPNLVLHWGDLYFLGARDCMAPDAPNPESELVNDEGVRVRDITNAYYEPGWFQSCTDPKLELEVDGRVAAFLLEDPGTRQRALQHPMVCAFYTQLHEKITYTPRVEGTCPDRRSIRLMLRPSGSLLQRIWSTVWKRDGHGFFDEVSVNLELDEGGSATKLVFSDGSGRWFLEPRQPLSLSGADDPCAAGCVLTRAVVSSNSYAEETRVVELTTESLKWGTSADGSPAPPQLSLDDLLFVEGFIDDFLNPLRRVWQKKVRPFAACCQSGAACSVP